MNDLFYYFDSRELPTGDAFDEITEILPKNRIEKIKRLRRTNDKRLSASAGLLLCFALSGSGFPLSDTYADLRGKPYFPEYPGFKFSLSHSGCFAACLISGSECGCDIEKIGKPNLGIADRHFSPAEQTIISDASEDDRADVFYKLWTLKESYIKFDGRGLALPLSSFSVDLSGDGIRVRERGTLRKCALFSYDIIHGYKAAVCLSGEKKEGPVPRPVHFDDIVNTVRSPKQVYR